MRARPMVLAALPLLLLLAGSATAQTFVEPGRVDLGPSQDGVMEAEFSVRNPVNKSLTVFTRVQGDIAQATTVGPKEATLGPLDTKRFTATVDTEGLETGIYHGTIRFLVVDPETGDTHRARANLTVTVPAARLLFDTFENPLPPPADNVYGLFIVETMTWIVGAFAAMKVAAGSTRAALGKTPAWLKREMVSKFTTPLYLLIFLGGLRETWRFFPASGIAAFFRGFLDVSLVLLTAFLIYRVTDSVLVYLTEQVAPRTKTQWDDMILPIARKMAVAVLAGFALFYALQDVGVDLGFLVAGGVVLGLVLSNSLGPTLQNLFSGLFILVDRPFTEGDDIRLDTGEVCNVRKIGLRSTRLYFYRNHEYIIAPNKDLENTRVVNLNFPDSTYKMHIPVGVAYGSPRQTVQTLLLEAAEEHPEVYVDAERRSGVFFDEFGESALLFRLVVFVDDVSERFRISSELRDLIDDKFREHGITIPFPQRTLWMSQIAREASEPGAWVEPPEDGNHPDHSGQGGSPAGYGQPTDELAHEGGGPVPPDEEPPAE